jgi:membrane associated rhomboid family serine protease
MGLYDREYTQGDYHGGHRHAPQMRMNFPQLTSMVKVILFINVGVFFLQLLIQIASRRDPITLLFSVYPYSPWGMLQIWRLITYQFLHANFWHMAMNMVGLYFLGPTLEKHLGSKRFLIFYLTCGTTGGVLYILLVSMGWLGVGTLVGASGAILGMLAACAILFPQFVVFFILFPVPIRVAAIVFSLGALAVILSQGPNAGGEAAHFGGMVVGALYVFTQSHRQQLVSKVQNGRWEKKIEAERDMLKEIDRVLEKVHNSGIHSLTRSEKSILKRATEADQKRGG